MSLVARSTFRSDWYVASLTCGHYLPIDLVRWSHNAADFIGVHITCTVDGCNTRNLSGAWPTVYQMTEVPPGKLLKHPQEEVW